MPNAAQIVERIRSYGANVVLDGDRLVIVNRAKLPEPALSFLRAHGQQIANFLDREAEQEERAGIVEFDGRAPREWAERFAADICRMRPAGVSELDWSWFLSRCAQIIDEAPDRKEAA